MDIKKIEHPDEPALLARTFRDFTEMVSVMDATYRHGMLDDPTVLGEDRTEIYKLDVIWALLQSPSHTLYYWEMHAHLLKREGDLFNPAELEAAFRAVMKKVMRPMSQTVTANNG